ncbi:MAG: hypothetical protein AAGD22_03510 [Verrucomicrobiota bacterium]
MKPAILTVALMFSGMIVSGCALWPWEPYPAWTHTIVSMRDVPKSTSLGFAQDHPGTTPIQIERSIFESRIQGRPKLYRFWIDDANYAIYDAKGEKSDLEFWFPEQPLESSPD